MSRRIAPIIAAAALCLLSGVAVAQQEVWACSFQGTWTQGSAPGGDFTWKVKWTGADGTWVISGRTEDSETKGTCDDTTCRIEEKFLTGPNKGETFYWFGRYTDEAGGAAGTTRTSFKGTWGPSPSDRKSGGTWQARATCKLQD
jgi:hypothetical protein